MNQSKKDNTLHVIYNGDMQRKDTKEIMFLCNHNARRAGNGRNLDLLKRKCFE